MQNELCKGFVHEIIKEVVFIRFKVAKIEELLVALCDGRPCKRDHDHPLSFLGVTHKPCRQLRGRGLAN